MKPLAIDERRVGRAAEAVDAHEARCWIKNTARCEECARLYRELAYTCDTAAANAREVKAQ